MYYLNHVGYKEITGAQTFNISVSGYYLNHVGYKI